MFRIFASPFPTLILSPTIPHRANERNDRCLAFCDIFVCRPHYLLGNFVVAPTLSEESAGGGSQPKTERPP
jgi:hypothetical protein